MLDEDTAFLKKKKCTSLQYSLAFHRMWIMQTALAVDARFMVFSVCLTLGDASFDSSLRKGFLSAPQRFASCLWPGVNAHWK